MTHAEETKERKKERKRSQNKLRKKTTIASEKENKRRYYRKTEFPSPPKVIFFLVFRGKGITETDKEQQKSHRRTMECR